MPKSATRSGTHRGHCRGFSMVELAVSMCVMLVLTAIAIPSLMRSFRTYQLNAAAAQLSDMLKYTRFEAVRRNTQVSCLLWQSGSAWIVGTDSNANGAIDLPEKQQVISGFATMLSSGVPSPTAITTALGGASLTTLSGSNNSVVFDARGAIRVGGNVSASAFVFYLGSATNPEFGYRAIILLPSGSTQIWTAPYGGPWQHIG